MSSSIWDKVLNFLGLEDNDEEIQEEQEAHEIYTIPNKKRKVVNIHTATPVKVIIYQPLRFEQASEICDSLKERKPVIVNLDSVDGELGRRILDFLSGAVYAMDGSIQKISSNIFVMAPSNVQINSNIKEELKDKILFKWQK